MNTYKDDIQWRDVCQYCKGYESTIEYCHCPTDLSYSFFGEYPIAVNFIVDLLTTNRWVSCSDELKEYYITRIGHIYNNRKGLILPNSHANNVLEADKRLVEIKDRIKKAIGIDILGT